MGRMSTSATPEALAGDRFVMARIAPWGPSIYIGLAAAAFSSAPDKDAPDRRLRLLEFDRSVLVNDLDPAAFRHQSVPATLTADHAARLG